jgi:natural product precursor
MKKLNKLQINSEKIMKNEELTTLRGGYAGACCTCTNGYAMAALSGADCKSSCSELPGQDGVWSC